MKPGDHPDFFRFPAPPGRSRESTIRLDAQGRFWHADELVEHPRMQRAFFSWISRHPDNGRYVLTNGQDWTYFSVEDVPFFVTGTRSEAAGLRLTLTDGTTELLEGPVWEGSKGELYVSVKDRQFRARFLPGAQAALGDVLEATPSGFVLRAGSRLVPVDPGPPQT